jgi:hypothetical protein
MWDLQRNGGNVVATTERILSGRGLEVVRLESCWHSFIVISARSFSLGLALRDVRVSRFNS